MTSNEVIDLAKAYSVDPTQNSNMLHRMFEKYEKEKLSEFGKTMIFEKLQNAKQQAIRFDLNQRGALKIIDHADKSRLRKDTYFNTQMSKNKTRMSQVMSGMEDLNELVHLQVLGKS